MIKITTLPALIFLTFFTSQVLMATTWNCPYIRKGESAMLNKVDVTYTFNGFINKPPGQRPSVNRIEIACHYDEKGTKYFSWAFSGRNRAPNFNGNSNWLLKEYGARYLTVQCIPHRDEVFNAFNEIAPRCQINSLDLVTNNNGGKNKSNGRQRARYLYQQLCQIDGVSAMYPDACGKRDSIENSNISNNIIIQNMGYKENQLDLSVDVPVNLIVSNRSKIESITQIGLAPSMSNWAPELTPVNIAPASNPVNVLLAIGINNPLLEKNETIVDLILLNRGKMRRLRIHLANTINVYDLYGASLVLLDNSDNEEVPFSVQLFSYENGNEILIDQLELL